jgi:transcriptional regulator with XRE-family HTH domain
MKKPEQLINLGKKVRRIRISKGMTQTELANKIGKDQQSINRLERGKINPSYVYLLEVSDGLNMKISNLLED